MNKIHLCIDALAADVADKLSQEACITITDALQEFMKTKTYALLFDENSLLYLESAEYIFDMLQAEQRGDWKHWTEV
jgi:hypothetical protein